MHHRPGPTLRSLPASRLSTPRPSPVLGSSTTSAWDQGPTVCGLPLKYVSLLTLALQNAALSIVMHYSRVSTPPDQAYSPATAVLMNELLKGSISLVVACWNSPVFSQSQLSHRRPSLHQLPSLWWAVFTDLYAEIFSPDAWKLAIPAILYVIQNSLQFVAISNLPVATFQVTYQMKILTTAAFSVVLLRRRLSSVKWLSLLFLAIGVGIVQLQTAAVTRSSSAAKTSTVVGSAQEYLIHHMSPLKGFGAVTAACFTSGLAGVYFEMVLKGSKADLWVRNVQLSLFSLVPALLPILYGNTPPQRWPSPTGFVSDLFRNFGLWAWATVAIQVVGGLLTAIVIKYSDNILKGFATSLSIVLSFLASVALFDFKITLGFLGGATTVLAATWMYNQSASSSSSPTSVSPSEKLNECLPFVSSSSSASGDNKRSIKLQIVTSSPWRSYPGSPIFDAHRESAPYYYPDHHNHSKENTAGKNPGVLSPPGIGSFMRRKPSATSQFVTRTSSTTSLTGTLSDRISPYTSPSTSPAAAAAAPTSDLASDLAGQAENGEMIHNNNSCSSSRLPTEEQALMRMGSLSNVPSLAASSYTSSSSPSLSTPTSPSPSPVFLVIPSSPYGSASASRAPSPASVGSGFGKQES